MNLIGIRIKKVRLAKRLTQEDFAARIGVKQNTIAVYEGGGRNISEAVIKAVCREFGVSYEWLTDGLEPMYVPQESTDMSSLEHIMYGDNEYLKSIFRELAEMPVEWWEQAVDMLKRIDKQKGRWSAAF